jgi:hypothetical protein
MNRINVMSGLAGLLLAASFAVAQSVSSDVVFLVDNAPDGNVTITGTGNFSESSVSGNGTLRFDEIGLTYPNLPNTNPFDKGGYVPPVQHSAIRTGTFGQFTGWQPDFVVNQAIPTSVQYDANGYVTSYTVQQNFSAADLLNVFGTFSFSPTSPIGGYLKLNYPLGWYSIQSKYSGYVYFNNQLIGRWQHSPEFAPAVPELSLTGMVAGLSLLGFAGWNRARKNV